MEIIVKTIRNIKLWGILPFCIVTFLSACTSSKKIADNQQKGITELSGKNKLRFEDAWFNGLKAKTLEDYSKALAYFNRCLEIDNNAAPVYYELALIQAKSQNLIAAEVSAIKANELKPNNRWYQDLLARLYEQNSKFEQSASVFEKIVEQNPNIIEYYYELGNMYLYSNQVEKAIQVFDKVEAKLGFSEEVAMHKYKLYMQAKDLEGAKKEINRLIEFNPSSIQYYGLLASIYREEGNIDKAIETFEKLKELNPDDPLILLSLSDYYNEGNQREKALIEVEKAFSYPTLSIDERVRILMNYYRLSETNMELRGEAYKLLDQTETHFSDNAKTFAIYGDFLVRDNKLKEARQKFYKSIELDDGKYLVWQQVLFINSDLNDVTAMLNDSEKAMELFPSQPLVYLFNGLSNLQNENYEKAALSLEQGQGLVIENPGLQGQFYSNLGDAYYRLEKFQQAWMNYERALRVNPENVYVLNNYAYYLSIRKENLELAKRMSYKTVQKEPTNATYLDTYGWILFQNQEYESAKVYIERAISNGGEKHGEILEHYGDVLFRLNKIDEAILFWKKAKKAGGSSEKIDQKISSKSYVE